jgi:hypothetical protein
MLTNTYAEQLASVQADMSKPSRAMVTVAAMPNTGVMDVVFGHEALALDDREDDEAQNQRDDGRPVQQEAERFFALIDVHRSLHDGSPPVMSFSCRNQARKALPPTE